MTRTYLFYDLETSGLNKAFHQIIQFSAIRTDLAFNELERYDMLIRPNPEVIPDPEAMIMHRTPIALWQTGEAELTAIEKIHALFNTPGTISLGYNTLGFDDEFLRFCFYRNLLAPYDHQYANQCSRADLYPIVALYSLYQPDVLIWPEKGLKLEQLNQCNQLASGNAHTAIVDVEICVALAKRLSQQRATWDYAMAYFDKATDMQRCAQKDTALYVSGKIGAALHYHAPVFSLGNHRHYKNQSLWLRLDNTDFSTLTLDNFKDQVWVMNKKWGESGFILPYHEKYLKFAQAQRDLAEHNSHWLKDHPDILQAIREHYLTFKYPPPPPNTDVDSALYLHDFPKMQAFQDFHKTRRIDNIRIPHLEEVAIRALGRYDIHLLSPEQQEAFQHFLEHAEQAIDYTGKKRSSREEALATIDKLLQEDRLDQEQRGLLAQLQYFIHDKPALPV